MINVEEKLEAMQTIKGIMEGRGTKVSNTVAEHIVDALMARGWRGPTNIKRIKEEK